MQFEYKTNRLHLKMLQGDSALEVLHFFEKNKDYYEQYEPDRVEFFYTKAHQKKLLDCEFRLALEHKAFRYYIFRREQPEDIIGTICFHDFTSPLYRSCEVGYKFDPAFQGQGYAREAFSVLIPQVFQTLSIHRILAMVQTDNDKSIHFLEKNGFQLEGTFKEFAFIHQGWKDFHQYALLAPSVPS